MRAPFFVVLAACSITAACSSQQADDTAAEPDAGDVTNPDDPANPDDPEVVPRFTATVTPITNEHRAARGAMFGGWGPHLGHLVQAAGATYWVDDLCKGDCDVLINRRVGVFRHDATGWLRIATIPLTGIQQNTATIAVGNRLYVYGIASADARVLECYYDVTTKAQGCSQIGIATGAAANYVGAATVGNAYRMVWWTNVVDGGGGSFSYIVNYGGGWNGPRAGAVGGYNDCGYAHVAVNPNTNRLEAFCQSVSGIGPNWSFHTLVGGTTMTLANAIGWTSPLVAPAGDSVMSTNDLRVDAAGTSHLLARTTKGAAVYYTRPVGGKYTATAVLPSTYRARWLVSGDRVAIAHSADKSHVVVRIAPIDPAASLDDWERVEVPLPADFGDIYAIYPASASYQRDAVDGLQFVVVGSGNEQVALHVSVAQ